MEIQPSTSQPEVLTTYDLSAFPALKATHPAPESLIHHQGGWLHSLWLVSMYSSNHLSTSCFSGDKLVAI